MDKDVTMELQEKGVSRLSPIFHEDAFHRLDSSDDLVFYQKDRFVNHLDEVALSAVKKIIGTLVIEKDPRILDLMAGWDSHIPDDLHPAELTGLGLNENELMSNKRLTGYVLHDINRKPVLPFPDNYFDAVLNSVSVDYMTHPIQVFKEVGRILKPGGLFLVTFSNRMFARKAIKVWRESNEAERVILVEEFFRGSGVFEKPSLFVSRGKARPEHDKYSGYTNVSDPVYALYADKKGGAPSRKKRPGIEPEPVTRMHREDIEKRKRNIKNSLCCPYCRERMSKWLVPVNPFACTWDNEFMYICFNDSCDYYTRGWEFMAQEGHAGSYRLMYNPEKDICHPVPVPSPKALREGIMDEDG